VNRAVHSGILVVLAALLLFGGGTASAVTAPVLRWTEPKAESRIERGTYRVFSKGEVFWANDKVTRLRAVLDHMLRDTRVPPHIIEQTKVWLADAEAELATATAGRALTSASCTGYYGRRPSPAGPRYTRFKCEATLVGQTWKTGAAMVYSFHLRPGGWNGRPTKHGFRVLGLQLLKEQL
jgi:hypothetical protein